MSAERDEHNQEEFEALYPQMNRGEWVVNKLVSSDASNIAHVINIFFDIFPGEFNRSDMALFAIGESAIPKDLLGKEIGEVDLRLVLSEQKTPKNGDDFLNLLTRLKSYNEGPKFRNTRGFLGEMHFNMEALRPEMLVYYRFEPRFGKPINIHLPFEWISGLSASIDDFEEFHGENFKNLAHDLSEVKADSDGKEDFYNRERLRVLTNAYIVRIDR